jgi:hypothetical protein
MLQFKCAACRFRLVSPAECPGCGAPVEQVRDLAEIVGFRAVGTGGPSEPAAEGHSRLAARVREVRASEAQQAWRRLDDDGLFAPDARR